VWNLPSDDRHIASIIERREYEVLEKEIRNRLTNEDWEDILNQIEDIAGKEEAVIGWGIPLREGIIRDAITHLLDIHDFEGLDGNFLSHFRSLDGRTLQSIRKDANILASQLLERQVKNRNTFFVNVEKLSDTNLVLLIPIILDARKQEIDDLEITPSFDQIYSSYYGFRILTHSGLGEDIVTSSDRSFKAFEELASQMGKELSVNQEDLHFSKNAFGKVSEYTRNLLWNLLNLCIAGYHRQVPAAVALGDIGDSRALDTLHLKLETSQDRRVRIEIISAIGRIGHPDSFELLHRLMEGYDPIRPNPHYRLNQDQRAAAIAIGGIRHPQVDILLRNAAEDDSFPIAAYGHTRNVKFIDLIVQRIAATRSKYRTDIITHLEALKALGPEGAMMVKERYCNGILHERKLVSGAIRLLGSISDFVWTSEHRSQILKTLTPASGIEDIVRAIAEDKQLRNDQEIKSTIQRMLANDEQTPSITRLRKATKLLKMDDDDLA